MSLISIHQRHPLHRDGTNRVSRMLQALTPEYFKLDDRSMQDIITAAHRYAQQLAYMDENNQPNGDWSAFWEVETLTYLAVLAAYDTDELRRKFDDKDIELANALETYSPSKGKPNPIPGLYRDLLNMLFDMAKGLETMYGKLVGIKHPMQSLLLNIIKRDNQCDFEELEGALQQLIALHKGADDKLVHERYNIFYVTDNRWGVPDRKHYDLIKPDVKLNRAKLRALFITFFNAYLLIVHRGQQAFEAELTLMDKPESESYRIVQPHVSLFIAFLRLFRYAQDSLNELTKKQLDYYYENILCLERQPAQPDHVHLIFTLAKNFDRELIEKGTLLLGGKDKNGQPMYYETLQDWVVTQAQVEEVKTLFIPKKLSFNDTLDYEDFKKSLLVTSFVPDGSIPHRIFGDDGLLEEPEIGFVIASPQLWLEEGNRWISIKINGITQTIFSGLQGKLADNIGIAISTKKEWVVLNAPVLTDNPTSFTENYTDKYFIDLKSDPAKDDFNDLNVKLAPIKNDNHLVAPKIEAGYAIYHENDILNIQIFLPADFDAVEPVEGALLSKLPAIKVILRKERLITINSPYHALLRLYRSNIFIGVRAEEVSKSLIVQTDDGVFSGIQKVLPFGARAPKGSKFYLGNWAAFLKRLDQVRFSFDWVGTKGKYGNWFWIEPPFSSLMEVQFLKDNVFTEDVLNLGIEERMLTLSFNQNFIKESFTYSFKNLNRSISSDAFEQFDPSLNRGFFRFAFQGDFGHSSFPERLAKMSMFAAKQVDPNTVDLPNDPYTPVFNSIKMDYVSGGQQMEHEIDEFFYLHPFGGFEKKAYYEPERDTVSNTLRAKEFALFPDYTFTNGINDIEGHLYIGLSNLTPASSLSLFVQTNEGSERDAEADVPLLHWSYLRKDNEWCALSPLNILIDTTRALTRSGIIQMVIPGDLSNEGNTMLNPSLLWIRISAQAGLWSVAALPSIVHVRAQVVESQLLLAEGLAPEHLETGQPPSSISKLATSRSAVKTITQPAATFNGRDAEASGLNFYLRISERLRHRDRAINAWDYEHLLMSRFADIASAKCINHTQYKILPATELAPGYVSVAVIPDLSKRAGAALITPRFPKGDLDEMRDYLNEHANLFLNEPLGNYKYLHLLNPQYEELLIEIEVKFMPDVDVAFFKLQLSKDLKQYLAPWLTDQNKPPVFGRELRKSAIVRYVEDLVYIDFIQKLNITKMDKTYPPGIQDEGEMIRPESENAILTSAEKHIVNTELL